MNNSNKSDIVGFKACAKELRRLLDEVEKNIKKAEAKGPADLHQAVIAETKKLAVFTNRTEPKDPFDEGEVESIRKINQIADEARKEIFGSSANAIIDRMSGRIVQLKRLELDVKQQAAANERRAKEARLTTLRTAIDAVTETARSVKDAKAALLSDGGKEDKVKSKVNDVLTAISKLNEAADELFESS